MEKTIPEDKIMQSEQETRSDKISKHKFIDRLCENSNYSRKEASDIYELFINTLLKEILAGNQVCLIGLGKFELKSHKGHKVHFGNNSLVDDYINLKFEVSHSLRKRLNNDSFLLKRVKTRENQTSRT